MFRQAFYPLPAETPDILFTRAGVAHATELAYVFGSIYGLRGRTSGDVELGRKMQAM